MLLWGGLLDGDVFILCIAGCDAESEACCDVMLTTTDTI